MRLRENKKRTKIDFMAVSEGSVKGLLGGLSWRYVGVYSVVILVFTFLFLHLFNLQIVEGGQNLLIASRINQTTTRIVPPRGLIFDTNGRKLAYNVPAYSLYLRPREVDENTEMIMVDKIADIISIERSELRETYKSKMYPEGLRLKTDRVTLMSDLSFDKYLDLVTAIDTLEGFYINVEPVREYVDGSTFAHIIGYVGDPSETDVKNGIYSESKVGKTGIESIYDKELRGLEGVKVSEKGVIDERERIYTPQEAKYGDNVILTIDSRWQKYLTRIMQAQLDEVDAFASAGVIMNSRTGEIKSLVSIPSYDNNLFAKGISGKDFSKLINDPKTPLMDRVIGLQLPPGSIWKTIGATAGLEEKVISENTQFLSDRCLELPGNIRFCEADFGYIGMVDVKEALSQSSNIFFCNVALEINSKRDGIRTLIDYADRYGLGRHTGIDLPGEQKGTMASPELKRRLFNEPWYTGDECNTIIGQGLVTVTPIQMTVVAAAIANGGDIIQPTILDRVEDQSGNVVYNSEVKVLRNINVSQNTLRIIREGMRGSAVDGTAQGLGDLPGNVIAKTGSSDAGEYIQGEYFSGSHSWVMGCFDYQGENYCFVTMQQWGGRGYKTVPIMKKFINCLYNGFADKCEAI